MRPCNGPPVGCSLELTHQARGLLIFTFFFSSFHAQSGEAVMKSFQRATWKMSGRSVGRVRGAGMRVLTLGKTEENRVGRGGRGTRLMKKSEVANEDELCSLKRSLYEQRRILSHTLSLSHALSLSLFLCLSLSFSLTLSLSLSLFRRPSNIWSRYTSAGL